MLHIYFDFCPIAVPPSLPSLHHWVLFLQYISICHFLCHSMCHSALNGLWHSWQIDRIPSGSSFIRKPDIKKKKSLLKVDSLTGFRKYVTHNAS